MGFDERMRPHATMGPIHDETSRPTIICACYWSVRVIVRKASNNNNNFFYENETDTTNFLTHRPRKGIGMCSVHIILYGIRMYVVEYVQKL